jgi:iron complex transport system permease protein
LAVLVGAGLGLVGTVMQAVVRNPLADPYLLGVAAGAALGAVVVLVVGSAAVAGLGLSGAAFAGAVVATALLYVLAQRNGRITTPRLVLGGVALAYLFQSVYSFLLLKAASGGAGNASSILFWLMGSLAGTRHDDLLIPALVLGIGAALLLTQASSLNSLLVGEESATALGLDVNRFRIAMLLLTSLLVGVMVAVSGAIAFVGLIIPHMVRLVVGSDHRRVLPAAALLGATFLVLVDLVARTADEPAELPLSIVTAVVGVPFFVWLLRRRDRSDEGVLS